jgi:hypothetical protein
MTSYHIQLHTDYAIPVIVGKMPFEVDHNNLPDVNEVTGKEILCGDFLKNTETVNL